MRQKPIWQKILKFLLGGAALAAVPILLPTSASLDARAGLLTAVIAWLALGRMLPRR